MDSQETIKKFENIIRLRRCAPYHPIVHNPKWYGCITKLDSHYGSTYLAGEFVSTVQILAGMKIGYN